MKPSNRKIFYLYLPSRAKLVYMYLNDRANKDGKCFPSINTIARELNLSRSTVKRALQDLEKEKLIVRDGRKRENGATSSNLYTLI